MDVRHAQNENKAEAICSDHVGTTKRPAGSGFPAMNKKMTLVAARRERLIAQAAAQRTALAQNIEPWRIPLARVDQGLAALRYIKHHPAWIVGGVALLAALRPGRVGKWMGRGWVAWQMLSKLRDK